MPDADVLFEVLTPLGVGVRVTRERWEIVATVKHPVMAGRGGRVKLALESPDEVRQSRTDLEAFLVTAYPTDAIKEGVRIWPK